MRYTIKQQRLSRGWTQARLAEETGIRRRQISRHERKERGPTLQERDAYARAFRCNPYDLEVADHRGAGRPAREARELLERFRRPAFYDPSQGKPSERNLPAARRAWPLLMGQLESAFATSTRQFLQVAPSESSLETLYQLLTLRREGCPTRVAPLELGFDRFPVVDGGNWNRIVGHCPVPAIVTRDWMMIFQVCVLTPRRYRMDALVVVLGPSPVFINLELDGRGHNPCEDAQRARDLGMPTLRLSEAEVLADIPLGERLRALGRSA